MNSSAQRSSREERGYHKYQAENSHRQPHRKKHDTSKSTSLLSGQGSALLASLLQCRPMPTDKFPNLASEFNDLVTGGSVDSWEEESDRYSSAEDSNDDESLSSEDEDDRYGVPSRGRSFEEKRGTNSHGRGGRRGRDRYRSPSPRSSRRGKDKHSSHDSPPKSSARQKKLYDDDETADRTRKRGNRKSDKKKTNNKYSSGRYGRGRHASESEYSQGVVSFIKEEEDEDDYSQDEQENDIDRYNKKCRDLVNNGGKESKFVPGLTSRMPRRDLASNDRKQTGLSTKSPSHRHEIPQGKTESISFSPSSSSETSFTLNTNFKYGGATLTRTAFEVMSRGMDESDDSASSSDEESEFSLNTMLTRQQKQQLQQRAAKKKTSPVHDTFQQYKRPDEKGTVEVRVPPGDVGVKLENSTSGPVVSEVSAHSVAPQLSVGDVIVALDGVNVDRFPGRAVMELLEARRTQPVRTIKYQPGSSALAFHAKIQAQKAKEQANDILDVIAHSKSEKSHEGNEKNYDDNYNKIDDALTALQIQTNMNRHQHMKKKGLQVNTEGPRDDVSLFSTIPPGMHQF